MQKNNIVLDNGFYTEYFPVACFIPLFTVEPGPAFFCSISFTTPGYFLLDNGFYTDVEYLILPFPYVKTVAFLDLNLYMYRLSLEGQSVSLESMQKNRAMHEIVLNVLHLELEILTVFA